ncbi:translocation/assembly module TamB domain-containing protein [Marinobacter persicus]|uniref:Translocation and assembly module TamB n=1 Tax=Marinobacter persicus TaxID=930118 RepID=A0A2S6G7A9_9GAMM|nr:translocation/assembly module TamB domain-containing protein [Marinobacter persicus]PPK52016.1 translocation and assembly module TamB [Marinobacter persicus]PPK55052.1 translocation and assembly module TamB [Marinobacter persicus]PPK56886.1 translocation and assembly module TamB [Marinobacter persicus]
MTEQQSQQAPEGGSSEQAVKPPLRRRWWFWALVLLGLLLILPLVLITVILLALRSETGTAWVIDQVPGLEAEAGRGSLLGQWQAEELDWQGYGVTLRIDDPVIAWSPSCLLRKTVCLDTLKVTDVSVDVQPAADPGPARTTALDLPEINLPVAVAINDVDLGALTVNGTKIWDQLTLAAGGSGAAMTLEQARYQRDDIVVTAEGRVELRGDWPLDVDLGVQLPPPSGDNWALDLNLGGSVRDVRLTGTSRGYLDAEFSGTAQPLDPSLPAELGLQSRQFLPYHTLPETLTLQDWALSLQGSLAKGFRTRINALLPGTTGDISASAKGLVTTQAVEELKLRLSGPAAGGGDGTGHLEMNGQASWDEELSAQAEVDMQRFPWYSLIPDLSAPPVVIQQLQGSASYRNESYSADLKADVTGPQGDASLDALLEGDLESVRITQLDISTGAGSLTGDGKLAFAGPLAWQGQFQLEQFNPGYWVPMLEASLNGQVSTEGRLVSGAPDMTLDWDLQGRWQKEAAAARGALAGDGQNWVLEDLLITVADNRVEGSGRYGEELQANLSARLPQPERLLPGLEGRLSAELELSGTVEDPTGTASLQAQGLAWQDAVAVDEADLRADLTSGGVLSSELEVLGLNAGGQVLQRIDANLNGTRGQHELSVQASHADATVALTLAGGLESGDSLWQGALNRGDIEIPGPGQTWQLEGPASLTVSQSREVTLGQHCWRWNDSSICAEDQQLWPNTRLALRMRDFPAQALEPLFPETFRWDAQLNATLDLALTDTGPEGELRLDAGRGGFEFLVLDEWERLEHRRMELGLELEPRQADLTVVMAGPKLGRFNANISVDPMSEGRSIDGRFSLDSLDLSLAQALSGLEKVNGTINGQGRLSGPLMNPEVYGELALTEGSFFDPDLPLPMEDAVLVLEFQGRSADISGRWKSNDRSSGQLDGSLDWTQTPELAMNITGERLPVTYEPYARVELEPDLDIRFRSGELSISGEVAVPRGDIEIPEIPESAVTVSEDEVIVGVEREEPTIRNMPMDVTVIVGEDQVTFEAFGITGDLEGTLRISDNMETRGALQLVDGNYEKFGVELELRRARVQFVGPLTEPYLDIEAIRTVDTVVAGIRISGPASAPETEVFSEPPMPQADVLSYLVLGRPPRGGQAEDGQLSQAAISLGLTQVSGITRGIGNELGIQDLTLETEGSGDEASVVASGYITEDLSLRYGVGIFEPITTVALRYDLGRYFYLEAASGLAASLDIFYTRDF